MTPSFCSRCGASVQADANFCYACGARLQELSPTPSQAAENKPAPPPREIPSVPSLIGAEKSIAAPPPPPVPPTSVRYDGFQRTKSFLTGVGTFLFAILWLAGIALLFVGG